MSIADRILGLYADPLLEAPGVLHVTAVWQAPVGNAEGRLATLRIGPDSPRSETDFFCLCLARARCDAIVTTGRILRDEPDVEHRLPPALDAWRRQVRGLAEPPLSVVLTGRADLDLSHPLLSRAARSLVVTGPGAAASLRARAAAENPAVEVVERAAPSLRDTVRFLQNEAGLASVCIEAGPSSSASLYDAPLLVDELMLSVFRGTQLAHGVAGGEFLSPSQLEREFEELHRSQVEEPSGPWSFGRSVRRPS